MLGINVSQATVVEHMIHHRKQPSQTWRNLLNNRANELVSIDFFTVPTATFQILCVLMVLSLERRQVVHLSFLCSLYNYNRTGKCPIPSEAAQHLQ
jgi:hypothetical protein